MPRHDVRRISAALTIASFAALAPATWADDGTSPAKQEAGTSARDERPADDTPAPGVPVPAPGEKVRIERDVVIVRPFEPAAAGRPVVVVPGRPGGMIIKQPGHVAVKPVVPIQVQAPAPAGAAGKPFVIRLGEGKREPGAYLGVSTSPAVPVLRQQLQLPKGVGLVVDFVDPKSPAEAAGVKPMDVLHKLNDQVLVNQQQLAVLVRTYKAGDELKLTVIRDGKPQALTCKLAEKDLPPLDEMRIGGADVFERLLPPPGLEAEVRPFGLGQAEGAPPVPPVLPAPPVPPTPPKSGVGLVGPGFALEAATITWDDGKRRVTIARRDGKLHLLAKDKDGQTLFDGPIDTPEQRKALPPDLRKMVDRLNVDADAARPTQKAPPPTALPAEGGAKGGANPPPQIEVELNVGQAGS